MCGKTGAKEERHGGDAVPMEDKGIASSASSDSRRT